jgi:hypothetical protein
MSPQSSGDGSLASLLADHRVPWETLHARYGPLLRMVQTVIGVVPNCDPYLEICEPGFRTYNIMVPNFLNLPFSIFGVRAAPADVVGMGMYVSSRTAECSYCSAHSCSFALRRGASAEKMAQALVGGRETFTPGELATVAVAQSLARVPTELTASEREELERCFPPGTAEWIVLGIVMMGFLNKFMNTIGVELEAPTVAEVATTMGGDWSPGKAGSGLDPTARSMPPRADSLWTKMRLVPLMPAALRLDMRWQRGVPGTWAGSRRVPARADGTRLSGALAAAARARHQERGVHAAREPLSGNDRCGTGCQSPCGMIFAEVVVDRALGADVLALAARNGVPASELDEARRFAVNPGAEPPGRDAKTRAALLLARAASPAPRHRRQRPRGMS